MDDVFVLYLVVYLIVIEQVKVDMGIPILKAQDVPTKLPGTKGEAVVQAELVVDGVTWNVTCVSMGNPHCITFGTKGGPVRWFAFLDSYYSSTYGVSHRL